MGLAVFSVALYLLLFPLFIYGIHHTHKHLFIRRPMQKRGARRTDAKQLPKPLWGRITSKLKFAAKDKRPFSIGKKVHLPLQIRQFFLLIYGLGLACCVGGGFTKNPALFGLAFIIFLIWVAFGVMTARPILRARKKVVEKMFEISRSTLGQSAEYAENPEQVVSVLEWRDGNSPVKARFHVPTNFNADSEENFLRQLNQIFGQESSWVAWYDEQAGAKGWDYAEGFVWLKEMPPLPQKAPWDEHYVLDKSVAWSFFPIALGIENGIEIANPATGKSENVLGFDLSGEQAELSKNLGTYCSPTITTSPMVLIAGGTGGGKALSVDTKVVLVESQ